MIETVDTAGPNAAAKALSIPFSPCLPSAQMSFSDWLSKYAASDSCSELTDPGGECFPQCPDLIESH